MSIASLYPSINPSLLLDFANSKVLDPRITFTRTTTATYYDGVTTAKAEENLLVQSQTLNNSSWSVTYSSLTANTTTAPDGTSTADTLTEDTTANIFHQIYQNSSTLPAGNYTFSIYAKANTRTFVCVNIAPDSSSRRYAVIADLSTGAITTTATDNSPTGTANSITSVGNGWYRVSVSVTHTSGYIGATAALSDSGTPTFSAYALPFYTGNGTSSIYLWGAQLEQRSSATAYTATTTQAITNYIPVLQTAAAGQARFDHNPTTGESLGLLIEEARTNLATYSADFSNAAWTKTRSSITSNTIVAPDGTLTGDKLVEDTTASNSHWVGQSFTGTAAAYTYSFYAKAGERSWITGSWGGGLDTFFDLSNGTIGTLNGNTATITSVGNGWYRCSITRTLTAASYSIECALATGDNGRSYTGNGFSGVFIWGAQLEAGSFATSYIPTTTASATRNADAASMTGTNFSSWFNNGEGTVYAEASGKSSASARVAYFSANNDTSNFYNVNFESNAGRWYGAYNGTNQFNISISPYTENAFAKFAGAYKVNDFALSFNASAASTDTSGNLAIGINQLNFGAYPTNAYMLNGTIKKLAYYPIRVTNAQLQSLTV